MQTQDVFDVIKNPFEALRHEYQWDQREYEKEKKVTKTYLDMMMNEFEEYLVEKNNGCLKMIDEDYKDAAIRQTAKDLIGGFRKDLKRLIDDIDSIPEGTKYNDIRKRNLLVDMLKTRETWYLRLMDAVNFYGSDWANTFNPLN